MLNKPKFDIGRAAFDDCSPLSTLPRFAVGQSVGFGFGVIPPEAVLKMVVAVDNIRVFLNARHLPKPTRGLIDSVTTLHNMFATVSAGGADDWFSLTCLLGHPSSEFCFSATKVLRSLHDATMNQDATRFSAAMAFFDAEPMDDILDEFLRCARSSRPKPETDWAYILWTSADKDLLHISTTDETIEDAALRIRRQHRSKSAMNVLGAWLVADPVEAKSAIRRKLQDVSVIGDLYRLPLGAAKIRVGEALADAALWDASPWHDCGWIGGSRQPMPKETAAHS